MSERMEQRTSEESDHQVFNSKCQSILHGVDISSTAYSSVQKPEIAGSQQLKPEIISLTPEKTNESLQIKPKHKAAELPDKYKMISEFFDRMTSSLRLLSLRKMLPTFEKICSQVEVLTGRMKKNNLTSSFVRKFTHRHLAQIKYILPEAVQAEKILIHEEKTLCMKPEMKITLLFDVVEGHSEQSMYVALQKVFASRLFSFINAHPKVNLNKIVLYVKCNPPVIRRSPHLSPKVLVVSIQGIMN
ncbi:hypothetical protein RJ639_035727 [Escallonia herrerae]|uniref:CDT1 Geminin-binding domain-containing protein n=1 Tax=Escallonia herrerae TaxID=1293975 RepID=A0AA88WSJ1_9ASTE|nr:hypothetical protein RJ639_035727 [Escallonia herrerae]